MARWDYSTRFSRCCKTMTYIPEPTRLTSYIISSLPLQIPTSSPLKAPATPNPHSILPSNLKISAHPSKVRHRFPATRKGSKRRTAET